MSKLLGYPVYGDFIKMFTESDKITFLFSHLFNSCVSKSCLFNNAFKELMKEMSSF